MKHKTILTFIHPRSAQNALINATIHAQMHKHSFPTVTVKDGVWKVVIPKTQRKEKKK